MLNTHSSKIAPEVHTLYFSVSAKYASRNNAGTVVHSYGDEELLKNISETNVISNVLDIRISQVPNDDGDTYTKAM